ncbi:HEPN domain-containing protein [Phosphitispora fastidiosa]|uniref:HEPN domain-containing protein n=1 Tax=Phosphitispora fastidiosa TaxID=2837202 RepID=UPI001E41ACE9|nr:HEPN domain-containing protein [Phosphitispora fastidiosa]MBU7007163.1 HEPN domain-containing protein [Phosphitispora fastidiosa]
MKLHEDWLVKAEHDLLSSKKLIAGDDPILDTAAYHTQQCAEKSLKAYLAYHGKPVIRTHDLNELVNQCADINPSFDFLHDLVDELNPYSTIFRYPGDLLVPEYPDVETAIEYAERIMKFVIEKIDKDNN